MSSPVCWPLRRHRSDVHHCLQTLTARTRILQFSQTLYSSGRCTRQITPHTQPPVRFAQHEEEEKTRQRNVQRARQENTTPTTRKALELWLGRRRPKRHTSVRGAQSARHRAVRSQWRVVWVRGCAFWRRYFHHIHSASLWRVCTNCLARACVRVSACVA